MENIAEIVAVSSSSPPPGSSEVGIDSEEKKLRPDIAQQASVAGSDPESGAKEESETIVKKRPAVSKSSAVNGAIAQIPPREPVEVSIRTLLGAGAHFGHQTGRWNPKMAPFIHSTRNGIHVINLPKTLQCWQSAREAIVQVAAEGGNMLFVGTKKQAQVPIVQEAIRCGAFYVAQRWLGGMITNFQTIRNSIDRMKKIEEILEEEDRLMSDSQSPKFTKKERLMMTREHEKLNFSLGGIRNMFAPPKIMFVVDIKREDLAIKEARRLDIPIVALVDTNCSPGNINFPIPTNDDGSRAISLFCSAVSDAVQEGRKKYELTKRNIEKTRSAQSGKKGKKQIASEPAVGQPSPPSA